jgi:flavorubredoxin
MPVSPDNLRTIGDGLHWLGGCQQRIRAGSEIHGHSSTFLIQGQSKSLLVDTGHSAHWAVVEAALDEVLGDGALDYVMPTHTEYPHAGNLQRLLRKYPGLQVVGDIRDYHLYYPDLYVTGRFHAFQPGDTMDLGGRTYMFRTALLRDLPNTFWGYDTLTQTIFVSDGFAYAHQHGVGECRLTSSEYDPGPNEQYAVLSNETALFWPKYVDTAEFWPQFEADLLEYPISLIAPAHGGVIDTPDRMTQLLKGVFDEMRRKGLEEIASQQPSNEGQDSLDLA